jgi:hypothetical protein
MPSISPPSELIRCDNLASCFQALYNFLFALLILLAFLNFLYGAFLYLLSGGGIYDKEKGRNKMRNSVVALLVAFIIPIILNMINPKIFSSELRIPGVEVTLPEYKYAYVGLHSGDVAKPPKGANVSQSGFDKNGFLVLKQRDPNFADLPFGQCADTIGSSGCGIVSLAMAIAYCNRDLDYLQQKFEPEKYRNLINELSQKAWRAGYLSCEAGTSPALYDDAAILGSYRVRGINLDQNINMAKDYLKRGYLVIANLVGKFESFQYGYPGHVLVLAGYDEKNKKFIVKDPGPYDVKELKNIPQENIVRFTAIECLSPPSLL